MPDSEERTAPIAETPKPKIEWSAEIGLLVEALAKAQTKYDPALRDTKNPVYNSKYADLASIINATQPHLNAQGLAIIQMPTSEFGEGDAKMISITTLLAHSSGQWVKSTLTLPAMMRDRFDSQSCGSAITYGKRYGYSAMSGVAPEVDDDGNRSAGVGSKAEAQKVASSKIRSAAKGNDAIAFTEWKEGLIAVGGENGLAIIKAETDPEELKAFGFKMDGNVLTIPAAKAHPLETLCKRVGVPVHWAESAKKQT